MTMKLAQTVLGQLPVRLPVCSLHPSAFSALTLFAQSAVLSCSLTLGLPSSWVISLCLRIECVDFIVSKNCAEGTDSSGGSSSEEEFLLVAAAAMVASVT